MIATINTDASFSRIHSRGTYAFWIVSNEFRMQSSGALKNPVGRPEMAEFQCIINAIHFLSRIPTRKKVSYIVLNTDCLNVVHLIKNDQEMIKRYKLQGWGASLVNKYKKVLKEFGLEPSHVDVRHVKAHVEVTSSKTYVNDWLDKAAKEEMGKLLVTVREDAKKLRDLKNAIRIKTKRKNKLKFKPRK